PVFYAAKPITDAGTVTGVLFAAVSMDFFFEPLKLLPNNFGQVAVEQQFESTAARTVIQYGNEPDGSATAVRIKLDAPTWTLVFKPSESATPSIISAAWIWTPLLVVIALV